MLLDGGDAVEKIKNETMRYDMSTSIISLLGVAGSKPG